VFTFSLGVDLRSSFYKGVNPACFKSEETSSSTSVSPKKSKLGFSSEQIKQCRALYAFRSVMFTSTFGTAVNLSKFSKRFAIAA